MKGLQQSRMQEPGKATTCAKDTFASMYAIYMPPALGTPSLVVKPNGLCTPEVWSSSHSACGGFSDFQGFK